MPKFRKKPVVIEAVQITAAKFNGVDWDGPPFVDPPQWLLTAINAGVVKAVKTDMDYPGWEIATLEGAMRAGPGDWIIRGVKGELYPCKPDIFAATYDRVED